MAGWRQKLWRRLFLDGYNTGMDEKTSTVPPKSRQRYQYTLRTLLIGIGLLSLPLAWWGNEKRLELRENQVRAQIAKLGGTTIGAEIGLVYFPVDTVLLANTRTTDADLAQLARLRRPYRMDLSGTQITDAGLDLLKPLASLRTLDLSKTHVTAEGVKKLQEALPNCQIQR